MALPVRRVPFLASVCGLLVVAGLGLTVLLVLSGTGALVLALLTVVLGLGGVALTVRAHRRGDGALVLTPHDLALPPGPGDPRRACC